MLRWNWRISRYSKRRDPTVRVPLKCLFFCISVSLEVQCVRKDTFRKGCIVANSRSSHKFCIGQRHCWVVYGPVLWFLNVWNCRTYTHLYTQNKESSLYHAPKKPTCTKKKERLSPFVICEVLGKWFIMYFSIHAFEIKVVWSIILLAYLAWEHIVLISARARFLKPWACA